MQLIEEIKVDVRTDFRPSALMVNTGVYQESESSTESGVRYLEDSYIPKDDWVIANSETTDRLTLNVNNYKKHSKIVLGKIPDEIKDLFVGLDFSNSKNKQEAFQKLADNPETTLEIERKLNKYLGKYNSENKFQLYKLLVLYPNRQTTAFINFDDGIKYIGMHFDSSTSFEIETAHTSQNRFCLNLGLEDRELYFVNLSLPKCKELILEKNSSEIVSLKTITPLFFKYYPNYPIIKLKIRPFEYYIAPTDNCIHEGTTLRKSEMDISITYLGDFNT